MFNRSGFSCYISVRQDIEIFIESLVNKIQLFLLLD